jgi:hypothetical protein
MKQIILILVVAQCLQSCFSQKPIAISNDEPQVHYYYGEVKITSPDGTIPYGPAKHSLVKRTKDLKNKTISELVMQDGKIFDTKLKETDAKNRFSISDNKNSFTGFLTFNDISQKGWVYDISMSDGSGKITGNGSLDNEGIKTEKYFSDLNGVRKVKIVENLKEITNSEYDKLNK